MESATGQAFEGGARAAALGGAATALTGDAWTDANVAISSTREQRALSFFAGQSYGLSELRLGQFEYVQPTRFGSLSAGLYSFGFSDFATTRVSVGYARPFAAGSTREFHLGVGVNYTAVSIQSYGSDGALGLTVAGLVAVSDELHLGFQGTNLNNPKLGDGNELERTLSAGMQYVPEDRVRILVDIIKDVRFDMSVRAGLELRPVRPLFLRTGVATSPTRYSAGVGVAASVLVIDIAIQRHDVLGWSPAGSMSLAW